MSLLRAWILGLAIACATGPPACERDRPVAGAATHACPMHPERTGGAGDRCPDCGMDLVPREQVEKQGR